MECKSKRKLCFLKNVPIRDIVDLLQTSFEYFYMLNEREGAREKSDQCLQDYAFINIQRTESCELWLMLFIRSSSINIQS